LLGGPAVATDRGQRIGNKGKKISSKGGVWLSRGENKSYLEKQKQRRRREGEKAEHHKARDSILTSR